MSFVATTFRIHRWLGWLVGMQVALWVLGGLLFAWLPFQEIVKGRALVVPPVVQLPADALARAAFAQGQAEPGAAITAISAVATPRGPALKLSWAGRDQPQWLPADGKPWQDELTETQVRDFVNPLLRGGATVVSVARVDRVPLRWGLVDEVAGRRDLWRIGLDDAWSSRIYLQGATGEWVATRNEAWVAYDFFWRLHIMDYSGGEDFNGGLLRAAALLAWGLVLAGLVLAARALLRQLRRGR